MRIEFDDFSIDTNLRQLSRRGEAVHLTPKAFDLLALLAGRYGAVVSKEEIHEAVWPGIWVDQSNLAVLIAEIRRALGDSPKAPRFIRTVHRIGYAFVADVASASPSSLRLRSATRNYELVSGENIVGRDPAAAIRLNAPGISRRHARLLVEGDRVTIEDLGSKNGTYVDGRRVRGSCELHPGSEIRLSREVLTVFASDGAASTLTDLSTAAPGD